MVIWYGSVYLLFLGDNLVEHIFQGLSAVRTRLLLLIIVFLSKVGLYEHGWRESLLEEVLSALLGIFSG